MLLDTDPSSLKVVTMLDDKHDHSKINVRSSFTSINSESSFNQWFTRSLLGTIKHCMKPTAFQRIQEYVISEHGCLFIETNSQRYSDLP